MNVNKQNFLIRISEIACFFFGIGCFFSTALRNICSGICFVCIFILLYSNESFRHLFCAIFRKNMYIWVCLFFGFLAFIGIFYSHSKFNPAWSIFLKYSRLAFYPIFLIPFFYSFTRAYKFCFQGLVCGIVFLSICCYIENRHGTPFRPMNPIFSSAAISMLSMYFFIKALLEKSKQNSLLHFFGWCIGVIYLFALNTQRTGVFMLLAAHFLFAVFLGISLIKTKSIFLISWIGCFVAFGGYIWGTKHGHYKERIKQFDQQVLSLLFISTNPENLVKDSKLKSMRNNKAITTPIENVESNKLIITPIEKKVIPLSANNYILKLEKVCSTLCPKRTRFLKFGWIFFKEKPLFGHGTASWVRLYIDHQKSKGFLEGEGAEEQTCSKIEQTCGNPGDELPNLVNWSFHPHNDLVNIAVQWGAFGLLIVGLWLFIPIYIAYIHDFYFLDKCLVWTWSIMLIFAGLCDLMLVNSMPRDFYLFSFSALFANACFKKKIYG